MSHIEDIVEKVGTVLEYMENGGNILNLDPEYLNYIPSYALKTKVNSITLENVWNHLSEKMCNKLKLYLPCYEHYNKNSNSDHNDGVAIALICCCMR